MDGQFKFFSLQDITKAALTNTPFQAPYYVESSYCVFDTEYFNLGKDCEFFVTGFDDGSFHVYDYSSHKAGPYKKPIFKIAKKKEDDQVPSSAIDIDRTDSPFKESIYEHSNFISCISKNPKNGRQFLTAARDSYVMIWDFLEEDNLT